MTLKAASLMRAARDGKAAPAAQQHARRIGCRGGCAVFDRCPRICKAMLSRNNDGLQAAAHGATVTLHTKEQRSCFCDDLRTTCSSCA